MKSRLFLLGILVFVLSSMLFGQVPRTLSHQGFLTRSTGEVLDTTMNMTFRLFPDSTDGSAVWEQNNTDVVITKGIFQVNLGPIPAEVSFSQQYWLETEAGGEVISPRTRLTSNAYTLRADAANVADDVNPSANLNVVSLTLNGSLNFINGTTINALNSSSVNEGFIWPRWVDNASYLNYGSGGFYIRNNSSATTMFMTPGNYVGVNTTSPNARFHSIDYAVYSDVPGVLGEHNVTDGYGVGGRFIGRYYGAQGLCYGGTYSGGGWGLYGYASGSAGSRYGLYAYAYGGSSNYGLYAYGAGGTTNYAGFFSGNVYVSGTFSNPSDATLKQNVQTYSGALSKLSQLRATTFDYKSDASLAPLNLPVGRRYGFIAQELEQVFPELVSEQYQPLEDPNDRSKDGQSVKFKAINYISLIPILVEGMKEQQAMIESQQKAIDELKAQLQVLQNKK